MREIYYWDICTCNNSTTWFIIIITWFSLLILFAFYYNQQAKHVFLDSVNDTWNCGLCIYVILICGICCLISGFVAKREPDVFFGLVGLFVITGVTAVLIILFLHKVSVLYKFKVFLAFREITNSDNSFLVCSYLV